MEARVQYKIGRDVKSGFAIDFLQKTERNAVAACRMSPNRTNKKFVHLPPPPLSLESILFMRAFSSTALASSGKRTFNTKIVNHLLFSPETFWVSGVLSYGYYYYDSCCCCCY